MDDITVMLLKSHVTTSFLSKDINKKEWRCIEESLGTNVQPSIMLSCIIELALSCFASLKCENNILVFILT